MKGILMERTKLLYIIDIDLTEYLYNELYLLSWENGKKNFFIGLNYYQL